MRYLLKFLVVVLFLSIRVSFCQEAGRALYDQGKFSAAFDALQSAGLETAADYYNAANALFKLGKTGQALSYYEKARALAPGNEDIRYNLKLAEEAASKAGSLVKDQRFWTGTFVPFSRNIPEEFADLLLALITMAVAWLAYRAKKQGTQFFHVIRQPGFLTALGLWAIACTFTTANILAHRTKLAAVVADMGVARSGPNTTFTELFKLPAGTTVELTNQSRDGWRQIRFSLGNVGWIMEKDLLSL